MEKETVERDYEEFKAPDTNNDDMISRAEFNIYVKKYLSSFPELSSATFLGLKSLILMEMGLYRSKSGNSFYTCKSRRRPLLLLRVNNNRRVNTRIFSTPCTSKAHHPIASTH